MQTTSPPAPQSDTSLAADETARRRRRWLLIGGAALVAVAALLSAGWYLILRDTSPPGVNSASQRAVREAAVADVTAADADTPAAEGLDGTWTIDTGIGDFETFSSTFAGFRIDESLSGIGANTVVGRTPDVEGSLEIDGTTRERPDQHRARGLRHRESRRRPSS